jgi:pimeloyl-ACP methyl ester carboxylesterase
LKTPNFQRLSTLFLAALGLLAGFSAQGQPGLQCRGSDIVRIQRPIFPDQEASPTFPYSFQVRKGSDPSAPTVVFLQGGPGLGSIGLRHLTLPSRFTEVLIDPRGVGCNTQPELPLAALNTEYLASDVLAIVRHLGLKSYYLHGVSYGTLLATVTAYRAEQAGIPPRGLVLEGVLGRALLPGETGGGYAEQWERLKTKLSPGVREALSAPRLQGLPEAHWGHWIRTLMPLGDLPRQGVPLLNLLAYLEPGMNPVFTAMVVQMVKDTVNSQRVTDPSAIRQHREISCREVTDQQGGTESDVHLKGGRFLPNDPIYCGETRLDRPFDAARYPLRSPIYYFSGEHDPITPLNLARHHWENQKAARRAFVTVRGGGHNALSVNLEDCAEAIWNTIVSDPSALKQTLAGCYLPSAIE